jgi:hypothetical protein
VEHHVVKLLIVELEAMKEVNAMLDAKFKVLGEIVDHHVKEEELGMFPKLRSSDNNLQELGAEIKSKKEELLAQLGDADDLGKIDPELAPPSTQTNRYAEEDHSYGNGTNGNGRPAARARNAGATARKGAPAKKSGLKATSARKPPSSAKKATTMASALKSKKSAAKKTVTKSSLATKSKKVTEKATSPKVATRTKAATAKPASAPATRAASSASKATFKAGAGSKAKKPAAAASKSTTAKKTAKSKSK